MGSGYEAEIVLAFLRARTEYRADGRPAFINKIRVTESTRETLERWKQREHVPLDKVDALLMRYDLMLFELEDWARVTYERDGFINPNADPLELVI